MSKKFDVDAYVSRWDDRLIPIMLVVIFASMIGVYAMNVLLRPACTTHDYVFCGTTVNSYEQEGHEAGEGHGAAAGPHAPAGEGAGHDEGAHEGHPH